MMRPSHRLASWLAALVLLGAACTPTTPPTAPITALGVPTPSTQPLVPTAKFLTYANAGVELIPGDYLVIFDGGVVSETSVPTLANSLVSGSGGAVSYLFTQSFLGFTATNLTDA